MTLSTKQLNLIDEQIPPSRVHKIFLNLSAKNNVIPSETKRILFSKYLIIYVILRLKAACYHSENAFILAH